jgi:ABC-type multidrug transport system fused ATPase/permease subunit
MLDQQEHRRGALVSRITGDVDQISQFLQWGGLLLLTSVCQVVLATVVMAFYSWQLTLLVLACFVPLIVLAPRAQRRLSAAYRTVRERAGGTLSAISESVTGATVVRAYGAALRTRRRVHSRVRGYADQQVRAQRLSVLIFSGAEVTAGVAMAGVIVFGFILGVAGRLTLGELTGFLFLITLFIAPVQLATEILNEAQNAAAGWRRVLGVLDMTPSVTDPGGAMQRLPAGELGFEVRGVGFSYLDGPPVLHDVNVVLAPGAQIAIVGETGSGKTTFAKLVTRLADPTLGEIRVGGVDLREISFAELRSRVAMVPQDAFLFNTTVRQNVTLAKLDATDADLERVFADLGLTDWAGRLPQGLDTQVGERGDALSAGERQLVAIARAYLADPSVLVLDEATSAVDPATDVRLQRAMDRLCRGRTTLTIAHRLFTAESADEVLVFDAGRLVQRGAHDRLVNEPASIYQRLHASWAAHAR